MLQKHGSEPALFLSTPSARRATDEAGEGAKGFGISIHALREEGDQVGGHRGRHKWISIHALREEGDRQGCTALFGFLISIHALREEGDGR